MKIGVCWGVIKLDAEELRKIKLILDGAKAAIEKFGWVQGTIGNEGIGYCALGAMAHASDTEKLGSYFTSASACFQKHLDATTLPSLGRLKGISAWNDDPDTTKERVLKQFEGLIEDIEEDLRSDVFADGGHRWLTTS